MTRRTSTRKTPTAPPLTLDTRYLPIVDVRPNPDNVRQDLGDLRDLTASIRAQGVEQPCTVYPDPDEPGKYLLLYGHRRRAAASAAGLTELPCLIREQPDLPTMTEQMLVENLQRSDLTPLEEGRALAVIRESSPKRTHADIGAAIGRSASWVSDRLAIVDGIEDEALLAAIRSGRVAVVDAVAMARAKLTAAEQAKLAKNPEGARWRVADLVSDRKVKAAREKLKDRYGKIGSNRPKAGPWGLAVLGDAPLRLNVAPAMHAGTCPGHVTVLDAWAVRQGLSGEKACTHYCTTPERHAAGDYVRGDKPTDATMTYTQARKKAAEPVDALAARLGWPDGWRKGRRATPQRYHAGCPHHALVAVPWSTIAVAACTSPDGHTTDDGEPLADAYVETANNPRSEHDWDDAARDVVTVYAAKLAADEPTSSMLLWSLYFDASGSTDDDEPIDGGAAIAEALTRAWADVLNRHRPNRAQLAAVEMLIDGPLASLVSDETRERAVDARRRFDQRAVERAERREKAAAAEAEAAAAAEADDPVDDDG